MSLCLEMGFQGTQQLQSLLQTTRNHLKAKGGGLMKFICSAGLPEINLIPIELSQVRTVKNGAKLLILMRTLALQ